MLSLGALWLPILISAVITFFASWLVHMVLPYHRSDFRRLPEEDKVMDALRAFDLKPGEYMMPCGTGPESMKDPAFLEKFRKGPVAIITIMRGGTMNMGPSLANWFVYCLVVSVFAAYVASRAVGADTHYLHVFRFVGATAFIGYTLALWQRTIWYQHPVSTAIKNTIDGLIYALLTAGTFGWLWPR